MSFDTFSIVKDVVLAMLALYGAGLSIFTQEIETVASCSLG